MNALLIAAALAATVPMPTVTGPVTAPGSMYPSPPISIVPTAVKVEDFPYVTEEYFLSGTAAGAPYTTRRSSGVRRTRPRSAGPSSPKRSMPADDR